MTKPCQDKPKKGAVPESRWTHAVFVVTRPDGTKYVTDPRFDNGECQKVWGNQAAHASVAGVLPGPRFWGDIVDA